MGWQWLCLAAHNENPEAQYKVGGFYENGRDPVRQDMVLAHIWYSLARANGFEESGTNYKKTDTGWACCFPNKLRQEVVAEKLSPAEIVEAERLVAEWQPNPAECEAATAQLGN